MITLARLHRLLSTSLRTLRLGAYAAVVFAGLAFATSRAVYADAREVGLGVGRQLAKLEDLTSGAAVVRVNGAEVHRSSTTTDQPVRAVLDRYEAYCRQTPSLLGRAMQEIPAALEDRITIPRAAPARSAILRDDAGDAGMVACFVDDRDQGKDTAEALTARLQAFTKSGDLSELGRFRYVFAERTKRGRTHVVTLWSDGPIRLGAMFPASGDAPGTDSAVAPRPPRSRRILSASTDGFPSAVRVYTSAASADEVRATYDRELRAGGFARVEGTKALAYVREDGAQIVLSVAESENATSVTLVESAAAVRGVTVESR